MNKFSPSAAISFGWNTFKANPGFLIGLVIIPQIITLGVTFILGGVNKSSENSAIGLISFLIILAVDLTVSVGVIKALLNFVDSGKGNFSDLFNNYRLVPNYVISSIFVGLFVLVGIILLIIPGFYFLYRTMFYSYFLVDKKMGPIEAIKASWNATKGNVWNIIGFQFLTFGVVILGFLALIVGLLVAIPVVSVATVYVYRKLAQSSPVEAAPVETPLQPTTPPTTPGGVV